MPYAEGRTYFDADSHLMELGDWLVAYADPRIRDRIRPLYLGAAGTLYKKLITATEGYAGEAPIIHQAVAVKAAIDALDAGFQESAGPN